MAAARGVGFDIELTHREGAWVGAGEPMLYITGSLYHLVALETQYLQKLGAACVAAYHAYIMCIELPNTAFLVMDARHCAGTELAEIMAYGARACSPKATKTVSPPGFVGNAPATAPGYLCPPRGSGTRAPP